MINIVDKIADRVRWGYLTAFILLLCSYILSFYTTKQLLKQSSLVDHTNNVINNLNVLQSTIKDSESSFRGYVVTRNEGFLDNYYASNNKIDSIFYKVR